MPTRILLLAASFLIAIGSLGCEDMMKRLIGDMLAQAGSQAVDSGAGKGGKTGAGRDLGAVTLEPGDASRLYYQFVDASSQVRFVERLEEVPLQWRSRVGYVEMDVPPPLSPEMAKSTRRSRYGQSYKTVSVGRGSGPREVLLYYADWCSWCKRAKAHLEERGVDFTLRDIDTPAILAELVEKTGQKGIPVIDVDGRILKGFNPGRLDDLLRQSS